MPTIYWAGDEGTICSHNPDADAEVGRWCKAPLVPDRCNTCFDPVTLAHYPAEGYYEDDEGWRYGVCHRCRPMEAKK